MAGEIEELQQWYESQCDGDWEHDFGMRIGTLDNPGWSVEINVVDTPLDGRDFAPVVPRIGGAVSRCRRRADARPHPPRVLGLGARGAARARRTCGLTNH
jgi:hypothetical protein